MAIVFGVLALAAPAEASFPGANGKIAFVLGNAHGIYTINPDGTGMAKLNTQTGSAGDTQPAWSADGSKVAFLRDVGTQELRVMNADGTGDAPLGPTDRVSSPVWSPDGTKVAFVRQTGTQGYPQIFVVNADGTGETQLTFADSEIQYNQVPVWSPDGTKIAFAGRNCCYQEISGIYVMNADGTGRRKIIGPSYGNGAVDWSPDGRRLVFSRLISETQIETINLDGTNDSIIATGAIQPVWSPDGRKIVFVSGNQLHTMNPDGTGDQPITGLSGDFALDPSWQPIPYTGYPRPKGASPMRASLVPAFQPCSSTNATHGSPLAFSSCSPPLQASGFLTVGTPPQDPANSVGTVSAKVVPGDVQLSVSVTDVRNRGSLTDYPGELESRLPLRITDKDAGVAATTQDSSFSFAVPCAATTDTTVGSTCSVATTADTLVPGAVTAAVRAIWALGQVGVYDGGPDGIASTSAGNTLFMTQGVFVP